MYRLFDLAVAKKCNIQEGITDRQTQTDGLTLVLRCGEGSKNQLSNLIPDSVLKVLDMRTL